MHRLKYLLLISFSLIIFRGFSQFDPEYMKMVIGFTTYIQTNNMDSLQSMIDNGYSPNFQDKDKKVNPLHYAIEADRPQAIKTLMENGADWNIFNANNKSARTELQIRYPELYVEINEERFKNNEFLIAIQERKFLEASAMIDSGININYKWKDQSNALHLLLNFDLKKEKSIVSSAKYDLLKKLLSHHINAKVFNAEKQFPLFIAMTYYPVDYTKVLLEKDSTLPFKDYPQFAFSIAVAKDTSTVKLALKYISDINMNTSNGKTMLYNALATKRYQNANCILAAGADTEKKNEEGQTVLNEIVANRDTTLNKKPAVKLLIKHHADVNTFDKNSTTPLINAVYNRDYELAKILVEAGTDVNYVGKGVIAVENALHAAVSRTDIEIVKYLLSVGAKKDVLDELNKTPLDKAKSAYNYHKKQGQKEKAAKFKEIMKLLK